MTKEIKHPCAAVAHVRRDDGKILVVWNKRYGRWSMPGGKVEPGEDPETAARRELGQEAGVDAIVAEPLYEGALDGGEVPTDSTRGRYVYVFDCTIQGEPSEGEPGCPTTWFTREEFLRWGLVPEFYRRMFDSIT